MELSLTTTNHLYNTYPGEAPSGAGISIAVSGDSSFKQTTSQFVAYVIIGCLGIIDNGFVVIVILNSRAMRHKVCNMFLINQSIVDLVAAVFLLCNSPSLPSSKAPPGILGEFYCRVWDANYFFWAAITASTYNLVALTIERYLEVVHPLSYKSFFTWRRAKFMVALVWAIGLAIPIVTSVIPSPPVQGKCKKHTGWSSPLTARIVGFYALFFGFILPVGVMLVCYSRMIMTLTIKVKPAAQAMLSEGEKRREEKMFKVRRNLIKTMFIVSLVFVICWLADQIYFFLFNMGVITDLNNIFTDIVVYMAFLNCCINPLIYTAKYREFQQAVVKMLKLGAAQATTESSIFLPD